jgi:uncharacterized protein YwgA
MQSRLFRNEVVLAALAPARGAAHTPVQVQKLMFLLDQKLPIDLGGPHFQFQPYHYGPFDKEVYNTLDTLAQSGLVEIVFGTGNWREYRLTAEGQAQGETTLEGMEPRAKDYIWRLSDFVRKLSFSELVSAIYKAYPQMRTRSVFQD